MARVQVTVTEAPTIQSSPALIEALDKLARDSAETLSGCPLYTEEDGSLHLFGLRTADCITTGGISYDNPRTEVPLRLFTACSGPLVGYGVDPLPEDFLVRLGALLEGVPFEVTVPFSFSAEVIGWNEYSECTFEFTTSGLVGEWSTFNRDEDSGDSYETDRGSSRQSTLDILTEDVARQYAADAESVNLRLYSRMTDGAAEFLASNHRDALDLSGLDWLSIDCARLLAAHGGWKLALDGLTELPPHVAEEIAAHTGSLSFDGIEELPLWTAAPLACRVGDLSLGGVKELSPSVAEALAEHKGVLALDGLTSLPEDVASQLARHNGGVSLCGVKRLTVEAARKLGTLKGYLWLDGIKSLPAPVAEALASGREHIGLSGLGKLSVQAARALASVHGALLLNGLSTLDEDIACELSALRGSLHLSGLRSLTPTAATFLAMVEDDLILDGLECISEDVAIALANHRGGNLSLNGLEEVSSECLRALANHPPHVFMPK